MYKDLKATIETLEKCKNDPKPEVTRGLLAYLRVLEACGLAECLKSLDNNICAIIALLHYTLGSDERMRVVLMKLVENRIAQWMERSDGLAG